LVRNMYCEVELRGRTKPPAVVVPRSALDQNTVRVVDADDRLHMRPVEVDFTQGNLAVLKNGVEPGERVVVSDLVPAVEGMLLTPVADEDLAARLTAEALGEGPAR
jgi:multidrug efflux pump subunit AcrA (membrane-fusion protein)